MDINQLSEIVKKKILENQSIEEVYLEDKSFLHKKHKNNDPKKCNIAQMCHIPGVSLKIASCVLNKYKSIYNLMCFNFSNLIIKIYPIYLFLPQNIFQDLDCLKYPYCYLYKFYVSMVQAL